MTTLPMESGAQGQADLIQRLELIERLVADGRRSTWSWGWAFVVWGAGHLAALAWGALRPGASGVEWGVTMFACGLITAVGSAWRKRREPRRPASARAVGAVWTAFVASLFLLLALGPGAALPPRTLGALVLILLGSANVASALVLRWRVQLAAGAVWWVVGLAQVYAPPRAGDLAFAAAALLCEVGFGLWLMRQERRGGEGA